MVCMYMWPLPAVLFLLLIPGDLHALSAPEILRVYIKDMSDLGSWEMNIEWRHGFTRRDQSEKDRYDLEIFYTEYMKQVDNETIEVKPDETGIYQWTWTSPIPLQCTSHSVRLRLRDHSNYSDWSALFTLKVDTTSTVYPQDYKGLVDRGIIFCCILSHEVKLCDSDEFTIQISNRTWITKPIQCPGPSPSYGYDLSCCDAGTTFITGYAPEVHGLTCQTPDLSSVVCHWSINRSVGFHEDIKNISYSINGRSCSSNTCVLEGDVDRGIKNWTLTAKNILGEMTLFDSADPKLRVRLKAPVNAQVVFITARNATLEWKWDGVKNYASFPMTCQVKVNDDILKKLFDGLGLHSVLLLDLQPFTQYKAQVRCASKEHFHVWGDWSKEVKFKTRESVPEAVDVWMQDLGGQKYIVWTALTAPQSHGTVTAYELLVNHSQERFHKSSTELCHEFHPGPAEINQISVSAKNSEFTSPPSTIVIPKQWSDEDINVAHISAHNGGFDMTWDTNPDATCGYILDWYPTYNKKPCEIKWMKVPPGVSNATIYSDFKAGVRYNLSVYACTPAAPRLLQRRQGYIEELAPSGSVQILKSTQQGSTIYLSWSDVPQDQQNGFITGFDVSYVKNYGHRNDTVTVIKEPTARESRFSLHPDTYIFTIKALTAAGAGLGANVTIAVDRQDDQIIMIIVGVLAVFSILLGFLYCKRNRLKPVLYPDIPKPSFSQAQLSQDFHKWQLIDSFLIAEKELVNSKAEASVQMTAVVQPPPEESKLHYYINPLDPPQLKPPGTCIATVLNYVTPIIPIPMDPCYMEVPNPGIHNPTYNVTVAPPTVLVSNYIPQVRNDNDRQ